MDVKQVNDQCAICQKHMKHAHLVRVVCDFGRVRGRVCCICVTRLANRQIPDPTLKSNDSILKESAPVPFKSKVEWGKVEHLPTFQPTATKASSKNSFRFETKSQW